MLWKTDRALDLTLEERQEIFDIIKTVEPGFKISWYCSHCVGEMLDKAFNYVRYE